MAGNRGIYNAAMKQAQAHAWEKRWKAALQEYQRAAEEFPDDLDARMGIASAYAGLNQWKKALSLYEDLHKEFRDDLVILERLAEAYVEVKDLSRAREQFLRLSNQYVVQGKIPQAVATLERLEKLLPQDGEVLARLAGLYRQGGNRSAAIEADLERVRLLFREEQLAEAMHLCEQVLREDPDNRAGRELFFRIRREIDARRQRGETIGERVAGGAVSLYQMEAWVREATERQGQGDLEGAIRLYERAVEAGLDRADVHYSLGLLYKEVGQLEAAIGRLRAASADPEYALSSHYTMGECFRDLGRLDQAAQEFERALHLVDLQTIGREAVDDLIQMYEAAASVYEQRNDLARAASLYTTLAGFLQSKRWRKGLTDKFRQRAHELTEKSMLSKLRQLGTGLLPAIEGHARGEPVAELPEISGPRESAIPSLAEGTLRPITDFLRRGGRPEGGLAVEPVPAIKPLEEALSILPSRQVQVPVRELDTTDLDEPVRELVEASAVYLERGLFNAALDLCCEVIRQAPGYLPIHLRMGEVYERQERLDLALNKYQALINTYLARGEEKEAVAVYRSLLTLSPDNIAARSRLAELLSGMGRTEEAAHELIQVAHLYFRLGQTNQAVDKFREVRALAPESKEVYLEYGYFLLKMDRPEAAVGELSRALQLDPQDPLALARMNIALALLDEEQAFWDSLATTLKRAREDASAFQTIVGQYKDPAVQVYDSPRLAYAQALLYRQGGHMDEVIRVLQDPYRRFGASPNDPMQLRICRLLAEAQLAMGKVEEAIRVLQQGLEWAEVLAPEKSTGAPEDPATLPSLLSFYHWLAEAYAKAEQLDQAIAALSQAKARYPHDRETSTKLADLYFRQGDLRQALAELNGLAEYYESKEQLDRALEIRRHMSQLAPNNLVVRERLGRLYIRRGYIAQGLSELEALADLQHKRGLTEAAVQNLQYMAEILWTMGQHDRAYQIYDRIVQLAPEDVAARQQLINLHILAGRIADALEEQRTIARITLKRKRWEDAVAALHQVLALDPKDRWALRELAALLASMDEHAQAVRLYRRLAKLEPGNAEVAERLAEAERLSGSAESGD